MSWAEVKKINKDMTTSLDERIEEINLRYRTFILSDNILYSRDCNLSKNDTLTLHFTPKISGYLRIGFVNVSNSDRIYAYSNDKQVASYSFSDTSSTSGEFYGTSCPITANEDLTIEVYNSSRTLNSTVQIRGEVLQAGYLNFISEEVSE